MEQSYCVSFSTFQCDRTSVEEGGRGQSGSHTNCTTVDDAILVAENHGYDSNAIVHYSKTVQNIDNANGLRTEASTSKNVAGMFSVIRKSLESSKLSDKAIETIGASWRPSTQKQYWSYFQRWMHFCDQFKINPFEASVNNVVNFLQVLVDEGLGYSAINTARSAVSSFISISSNRSIGSEPLVQRFLKGVFNQRPALTRNSSSFTWDISIVLNYLRTLYPLESLSLAQLTNKTVMLLALLTGQRGQTIHALRTVDISLSEFDVKIKYSSRLKTTRPGFHLADVTIEAYKEPELCLVQTLCHYIVKTNNMRKDDKLFISTMKPHKPVSRDTISRWIKTVMKNAGIDITKFTPHSTRAAATSAAKSAGLPVADILKSAGWTKEGTFYKFYDKLITQSDPNAGLSKAILNDAS